MHTGLFTKDAAGVYLTSLFTPSTNTLCGTNSLTDPTKYLKVGHLKSEGQL